MTLKVFAKGLYFRDTDIEVSFLDCKNQHYQDRTCGAAMPHKNTPVFQAASKYQ